MNSGITLILQQTYDHLPLYAEEGGECTQVRLDDLVNQIDSSGNPSVLPVVTMIQRLYCALGLLDEQMLKYSQWRFVSFPASLMARSILKTLADTDQSLFTKDFWSPQDSASPLSDQQRNLLHSVECQRVSNHETSAEPIRFVHVAWGLIVIDGKVLLRHREDKSRPNLNNYVIIGGRLSQNDLRKVGEKNALSVLQSPFASENEAAIHVALQREIKEETGLDAGIHYTFKPWHVVKPYRAVEGAVANHALTEYRINVFHIQLTQNGLFELFSNIKRDEHLTWFTLDELSVAKTTDGKMAYLNALIEGFESKDQWVQEAKGLASSYRDKYAYESENDSVTLPVGDKDVLELGKTGKERRLNIELTAYEKSLLIGLNLITGFVSSNIDLKSIKIVGLGWVKVFDDDLCSQLKALVSKLVMADLPIIESRNESYFRLAIKPACCYLSDSAYSFSIENACIILMRDAINTPLGRFKVEKRIIHTSKNLAEEVARIASNIKDRRFSDEDLRKIIRRDVRPGCNKLGLRTLLRSKSKHAVIRVNML